MVKLKNLSPFRCGIAVVCSAVSLAMSVTSCDRSYADVEKETPEAATVNSRTPIYMATSVAVRTSALDYASSSQAAENEVKQLRILAFDSNTGLLAVNKFYDTNQQSEFSNQVPGASASWQGAFAIVPGTYDFFFVANENSWPEVKRYLNGLQNGVATSKDMYTHQFTKLVEYGAAQNNEGKNRTLRTFYAAEGGNSEHLFLATRCYKDIVVDRKRNGKGKSQSDPQHFIAEGDETVDLIRTLAKVQVRFSNAATAEADGQGGFRLKQFLPSRIQKLVLKQEMPYQSLFLNPYFESNVFPVAGAFPNATKYTSDWYTEQPRDYVLYNRALTSDATKSGLSVGVGAQVIVPNDAEFDPNRRYDCLIWFYVPEFLKQNQASDPATPGFVDGVTHLSFEKTDGKVSNVGIWQPSFEDGAQKVYNDGANSKYFVLPDAADYSKYSVVRNSFYDITVKYSPEAQLRLHYKVLPWGEGDKWGTYVQDAYNVFVVDRTFAKNLTDIWLTTASSRLLNGESITLRAKAGYKFVDTDGTEKDEVTYGTGADENKFRHRRKIQLKAPGRIAAGKEVFDVLSGGVVKYTVTATE